jgi:hypothetical protein
LPQVQHAPLLLSLPQRPPPEVLRSLYGTPAARAVERAVATLSASGEFLEALVALHALGGNMSMHLVSMLAPAKTHRASREGVAGRWARVPPFAVEALRCQVLWCQGF